MPTRRTALALLAGSTTALALGTAPPALAHGRPFGRYGSPPPPPPHPAQ